MYIFLEHREKNRRRREKEKRGGGEERKRENSILANSDGVKVGQRGLLT